MSPPQKRAFEKYKPQGLFSEFYGISKSKRITAIIAQSPLLGFQTPIWQTPILSKTRQSKQYILMHAEC